MFRPVFAAAIALAACSPAFAQSACGDAKQLVERLTSEYGEQEAVTMTSMRGPALTIYANPSTGTFTVFATTPSAPGVACVIDVGKDFTILPIGTPA